MDNKTPLAVGKTPTQLNNQLKIKQLIFKLKTQDD
jgi:hypothetical protein